MKRPGYREAVEWLAGNDDCYWIGADEDHGGETLSVSASMVRDLYDVAEKKLVADITNALRKIYPTHEVLNRN